MPASLEHDQLALIGAGATSATMAHSARARSCAGGAAAGSISHCVTMPLSVVSNARYPDEVHVVVGFRLKSPLPHDSDAQKRLLAEVYGDAGWQTPRLLQGLWEAPDRYVDAFSQVHVDRLHRGRVVLLGDAGYGATVDCLAIVCAYILAGELAAAHGDHAFDFPRYAALFRDCATGCQKLGKRVGPFLAPSSRAAIWRRDLLYRLFIASPAACFFDGITTKAASNLTLPEFPMLT